MYVRKDQNFHKQTNKQKNLMVWVEFNYPFLQYCGIQDGREKCIGGLDHEISEGTNDIVRRVIKTVMFNLGCQLDCI